MLFLKAVVEMQKMNNTIDRDSDAMRVFVSALSQFCSDMNFAVLDMVSCCNESSAMMQDKSGQEALRLIHDFAEEMGTQIAVAERLKENVLISAQYIEESDQLL